MLEAVGISVEFSHHEAGSGQNEIDLRATDAMSTADNIMTARTVIKEVPRCKTCMLPYAQTTGSPTRFSVAYTFSLFESDANAFYEAGAQYQLSTTARRFIAGMLEHSQKSPPSRTNLLIL